MGSRPPGERPEHRGDSHERADVAQVYLALGVHNHQPVGNFDWVLRKHFEQAYLPFLDVIERHPAVPFSLHVSGPLLLWLAETEPQFLNRIRTLVDTGRVELKAGGFYEPILAIIPEADAHEQLRRMGCFLEERFGAQPHGVWLAERIWEPHLARVLADAGLEYAVLDDSHFLAAGVAHELTHGYFVTEEQGRRFDLFPISRELRYLIPFREPQDTLDFLRRLADGWNEERRRGRLAPDAPPPLAVYDDDGEKFGGWPGTHTHVYEAGWLERFLGAVEDAVAEGWLGLVTLGEFRRRFPPLARAYLPTASYTEMLEWSGGFFRNFLVRYDEANLLHKRMLYTGSRVRGRLEALGCAPSGPDFSAPFGPGDAGSRLDHAPHTAPDRRAADLRDALLAHDHLLRAQCNDAFWHGVFGGLYLPHLRDGVTRNLLSAERLLGEAAGPSLEILDLDLDGHDEVVLRADDLVAIVAPARGGSLLAIDHLPSGYALLNSLRRRREPEHAVLAQLATRSSELEGSEAPRGRAHGTGVRAQGSDGISSEEGATEAARTIHDVVRMKEPGLERLLFEDRFPRTGFVDRFLPLGSSADATLDSLLRGTTDDAGDFAAGTYAVEALRDGPGLLLSRRGEVSGVAVAIEKLMTLESTADAPVHTVLRVGYRVMPLGPTPGPSPGSGSVRFGPELTVNLLAGWEPDRYLLVDGNRPEGAALADAGLHHGADEVHLIDDHVGLAVHLAPWKGQLWAAEGPRPAPATLFRYGVVTVSQSEDGFERIYQGTALLPTWELPLVPATVLTVTTHLEITGPAPASSRGPQAARDDPPNGL